MQNDWEQDITNHSIELWLPIGVAFVLGGHHSIAAGVLYSKGNIYYRQNFRYETSL